MLQIDPRERAAECERALRAANDPTQRKILIDVQELWIGLANAKSSLTEAQFDEQVEAINGIHTELIGPATVKGRPSKTN
jgi:hypothetical protein